MKTSEETLYLSQRFGDERAVQILAGAGFDHADYSMPEVNVKSHPLNSDLPADEYLRYADHLREFALSQGITFNQAHAPLEWRGADVEKQVIPGTVRALETASVLGVDTVIVHPLHFKDFFHNMDEVWDDNMRYYEKLLPYAHKYNVRICLENLFQYDKRGVAVHDTCSDPARYIKALDTFHDPHLVACVDVGHACLLGESPADLIRALGHDRLHALHIHDNKAVLDDHTMPYFGKIDWEDVTKALAEIDYDGVFTLESFLFYKNFPDDFVPVAAHWQHDMAAYLVGKIENYKKQLRPES